ncbi:NAD-glutamate dehydrogenase [Arenimonas caeni]|jgi:glutamate dehydrogenase|uniref:NAD-glutamate dehydrogenase n=1 Tax=Arenimonas caeni TaxID=2058085 RepID=UPI002A372145|nr:NAD-glutamate dehydrogenase domain-containing protein [Arenimonas caeni]MDY0022043.1 NAD-glutamate dehydrogenase [Arenimonas caeni]
MNAHALASAESLDAIAAAIAATASAPAKALEETFARSFFARVPEDELTSRSAAEWAAVARSFLAFAGRREAGKVSISLSNPSVAADGYDSTHTVVRLANDDMPFLVDSVRMALSQFNISLHQLAHPVMAVRRDESGKLVSIGEGHAESFIYLEIDRLADAGSMAQVEQTILAALADVRAAVADWLPMRERMLSIAGDLESSPMPVDAADRAEAQSFLRWAADNHFTFLGYREYEVVGRELHPVQGSGLGLLRGKDQQARPRPVAGLAAADLAPNARRDVLVLTKTNARATVHRPGYMDYIGVLEFDAEGRAVRERRFLGLYTSSAYNRRPWEIPLVRQRHEFVMAASGLAPTSHSGKALRHILETLPREELFQSSAEELQRTAMGILSLQERARTRLFLRRDRYGRFFSALVYIPRDRFNTGIRLRIEAALMQALGGERLDHSVQIGESPLAQLHLVIRPKAGATLEFDQATLESELVRIVRDWHDELREILVREAGEEQGLKLAQTYGRALPAGYIESVSPEMAAADVLQAARLSGPGDQRISFYRHGEELRLKLVRRSGDIALSDVLPVMENLGLRVLTEHPYELEVEGERISIQDFEVQARTGAIDVDAARLPFEEAFNAVWSGEAENDGLNQLLTSARLEWRDIAMLRGYTKYALQTGVPFSQTYMEETLQRYPVIARLLYELFAARFEPGREQPLDAAGQQALHDQIAWLLPADSRKSLDTIPQEIAGARALDRAAQIDAVTDALEILLDTVVQSIDDDRILRGYQTLIKATLRTNFYQRKAGRFADYIAFKFDPALIPDLPKPRPYREIFVYSPYVEGVHLRFGPVARGGLRWSDRREDFRTEVLGLVKAQMVKNTVIVPVGSKGGFVVKRPPVGGDRDAQLAEGIACYKRFINGLLDITDNLVDGAVVPPVDVVRHDGDDPYLVVAADKGTASFSDIANGISAEHGYWLGDAFASGGSVGYDHKGMGITARGAWESVKRHFRALGIDSQSQDFTCVGVGDMSGDVFGNGMLLSRHIRLVAAFDHRHIFLDPNPDSARSYVERERLFRLPRSSWEDYDKSLISEGGGVHPRSAKSIAITPQVRAVLGLADDVEQLSPMVLMNAILKAPVDLLWNGGIGTYVKGSSESHADVGDRANNGLRVNGGELRCRAVGEGGNLGFTQRGRIEAAQAGVLLNTDFIDNSAGVDTSDHEVNIKILLSAPVQRGELKLEERNALLASMTDEVAGLVLNDNYRQNQAISLMERMSEARLGSFGHFIQVLEGQGLLDRAIEYLPTDAELAERKARGQGLTRPELSVLLSYDKIVVFNQMLDSDVPEDPYLGKELVRYFPEALQERFAADMENHRLRREIIATAVTNSTVNRMGATFLLRMQEDTGQGPAQIAKAFTISREVLDARALWAAIDGLDLKVSEEAQLEALASIWHLLRNLTRWLLNRPGETLNIAEKVERYAGGVAGLRAALSSVLPEEARAQLDADEARWLAHGYPADLARAFASLPFMAYALDIVEVSIEQKLPVVDVATAYFSLSDAMYTKWLMDAVEALPVAGRWHAQARGVLRDELQAQQRALVGQVLAGGAGLAPEAQVARWLERDDPSLRLTQTMFADLRNLRELDYPTLSVAVRRLAQVVAAGAA